MKMLNVAARHVFTIGLFEQSVKSNLALFSGMCSNWFEHQGAKMPKDQTTTELVIETARRLAREKNIPAAVIADISGLARNTVSRYLKGSPPKDRHTGKELLLLKTVVDRASLVS